MTFSGDCSIHSSLKGYIATPHEEATKDAVAKIALKEKAQFSRQLSE